MKLPKEVQSIIWRLREHNFEAYIVGGCVRDFLLGRKPKDWDVATDAKPNDIQKIFPESFYNNRFGTVTVINKDAKDTTLRNVEVTTYRVEAEYSDRRHPDDVKFTTSLEKDLSRRDFTINAMALGVRSLESKVESTTKSTDRAKEHLASSKKQEPLDYEIIDLFGGQRDLKERVIRAVGDANKRFNEDALRMLRAVRFACELDFKIERDTFEAIKRNSNLLKFISKERIRDELERIILSQKPSFGIDLLQKLGLLKYIIPELEAGIGIAQNRHHIYTIYKHSILSLKYCPSKKLEVRLAALLHDIAKPQTKEGTGPDSTFYNHDYLGAKFTSQILRRLKFPRSVIGKTSLLVRNHMFYYNVGEVSEAGVRRLIRRVGKENLKDLIDLRIADRLGSGVPKAKPYKLRHLEYLIHKVSKDPISPKMLKVNGEDVMKILGIQPGPKVGAILKVLLSEIIEDPKKNTREYLERRIKELDRLSQEEIEKSEKIIKEKKEEEDLKDKSKFWVK